MNPHDFNNFRNKYNTLSYKDQVEFYSTIYKEFPIQNYCTLDKAELFFQTFKPNSIFEIGGWTGYTANKMINKFDCIDKWTNYEVCVEAVLNSEQNSKYMACITNDYLWNLPLRIIEDALFMSHVIEHMTINQFENIIIKTGSKYVYIEAPLPETGGYTWENSESTHVMSSAWDDIENLMTKYSYNIHSRYQDVRFFTYEYCS